ncbi:MAG: sterol desaturase family protein [Pirellulales bacterium]
MDYVIQYFSQIPTSHRILILVGGITFFWVVESAKPLFDLQYNKWRHAGVNIFFTLTTILVNFCLAFVLLSVSDWTQIKEFGLLQQIYNVPAIGKMIVGLMLLDLIGAFTAHWAEHKVKLLWRFHLIHHTDTAVDTTTANRHHPGESLIRFVFTTLAVLIVGAPMWLVMLYQSLSVVLSQFNHANIGLPDRLDRWLSWIIVTPDMHHIHHHFQQPLTDSNYGNIFAIWDRLCGTFVRVPRQELKYGIDTYPDSAENSAVVPLLRIPFQKYRPSPGADQPK